MSAFTKLRSVLVIVLLAAVFVGCSSDDDNGTGSTAKTRGSDYDLGYLLALNTVSNYDHCHVDRIQCLLDLCREVENAAALGVLQSLTPTPLYHASSGYWFMEHTDTSYYGIEVCQDSVQFLQSGVPVEIPESELLTEIRSGTHWVLYDTSTVALGGYFGLEDVHCTIDLSLSMSGEAGEIAAAGNVILNSTTSFDGLPPEQSSDCDYYDDIVAVGDNLGMNLTVDNCPKSGEISYSGRMTLACPPPAPSFDNSWTAKETFSNNGYVTWHFENESYYWDRDGYCSWYLDF
jgi:hypothetical protein